jgi:hypothetical protein
MPNCCLPTSIKIAEQTVAKEGERIAKDKSLIVQQNFINNKIDALAASGELSNMDENSLFKLLSNDVEDNQLLTSTMKSLKENNLIRESDKVQSSKEASEAKIRDQQEQINKFKIEEDVSSRSFNGWDGEAKGMTSTDRTKIKEAQLNFRQGMETIDTIISISKQLGQINLGIDQDESAQKQSADTLARALRGSLRLEIVGPGALTEKEMAILEKMIPNPTDIFKRKKPNIKALQTMKGKIKGRMKNLMGIEGLNAKDDNKWFNSSLTEESNADRDIIEGVLGLVTDNRKESLLSSGVYNSPSGVQHKIISGAGQPSASGLTIQK